MLDIHRYSRRRRQLEDAVRRCARETKRPLGLALEVANDPDFEECREIDDGVAGLDRDVTGIVVGLCGLKSDHEDCVTTDLHGFTRSTVSRWLLRESRSQGRKARTFNCDDESVEGLVGGHADPRDGNGA